MHQVFHHQDRCPNTDFQERDEAAPEETKEDDRDAPGSPSLGAAGGAAPALLSSLLSAAYQPAQPGTGACRHTTEGWKALESSVRAVHHVAAGAGAAFAPHVTPELRAILYDCFSHMNRFVRETAYLAAAAVCAALRGLPELAAASVELAERLRDGLSDNWSQVSSPDLPYRSPLASSGPEYACALPWRVRSGTMVPKSRQCRCGLLLGCQSRHTLFAQLPKFSSWAAITDQRGRRNRGPV